MREIWDKFWFSSVDPRQYAALRIAFGVLSAIYFAGLLPYAETQFSASGWLAAHKQMANQNGGSWSLFFIPAGAYANSLARAVFFLGIVSSLLMTIGWHSRLMACLSWLIWVSVWNRNPLLLDGDDAVLKLMCFYLMLSACGNVWSIDACRFKHLAAVPVWPLRLIQFQIALLYFVSGLVKFQSPEWENGMIMQYILIHPHYSRWDGWPLIAMPFVKDWLAGLAWFIRGWELLFPVLLAMPYTRKLTIAIGILFHGGLLITMNLRWFAVIMPALYLALIPNQYFRRAESFFAIHLKSIKNWRKRA